MNGETHDDPPKLRRGSYLLRKRRDVLDGSLDAAMSDVPKEKGSSTRSLRQKREQQQSIKLVQFQRHNKQ
ncbi:hypothetical protein Bca4012_065482 [Brassica carinata]